MGHYVKAEQKYNTWNSGKKIQQEAKVAVKSSIGEKRSQFKQESKKKTRTVADLKKSRNKKQSCNSFSRAFSERQLKNCPATEKTTCKICIEPNHCAKMKIMQVTIKQ